MLQNGTKSIVDQILGVSVAPLKSKSATDIVLRSVLFYFWIVWIVTENHAVLDNKNETEKLRIVSRSESFGIQFSIVAVHTVSFYKKYKNCMKYSAMG